jgi:hypothetical protein
MNDDTLTLYYYNDGLSNRERQAVAHALATNDEVAARYQALCRELEQFEDPSAPRPPADMVQRWHDSLDRAAGMETRQKPAVHSWSFLLGAAVTAALAIGVGIGFFLAGDDPQVVPVIEEIVASGDTGSSAFTRGLQVHFRDSEQGLLALDDSEDRAALILDIIEQNKRFERAAEQNDADDIARVLRAFDLVLVKLAAEDISDEDAEALRAKLLFELNVMLTKLSRETSDGQQSI